MNVYDNIICHFKLLEYELHYTDITEYLYVDYIALLQPNSVVSQYNYEGTDGRMGTINLKGLAIL